MAAIGVCVTAYAGLAAVGLAAQFRPHRSIPTIRVVAMFEDDRGRIPNAPLLGKGWPAYGDVTVIDWAAIHVYPLMSPRAFVRHTRATRQGRFLMRIPFNGRFGSTIIAFDGWRHALVDIRGEGGPY